jgi:hypothetical protein
LNIIWLKQYSPTSPYDSDDVFFENVLLPVRMDYMSIILHFRGKATAAKLWLLQVILGFMILLLSKPALSVILEMCKVEGNLKDGRHTCAGEQLMAYLYMASGRSCTTQRKVANELQRSTPAISKMIANIAESIVAINVIEAFSDEELLKK